MGSAYVFFFTSMSIYITPRRNQLFTACLWVNCIDGLWIKHLIKVIGNCIHYLLYKNHSIGAELVDIGLKWSEEEMLSLLPKCSAMHHIQHFLSLLPFLVQIVNVTNFYFLMGSHLVKKQVDQIFCQLYSHSMK